MSLNIYEQYISIDSERRSGKPCIKGTRISVSDILEMFADNMTIPEIISDFPQLDELKIKAALNYSANQQKTTRVA